MQGEHGNVIVPPPTCSLNYITLRKHASGWLPETRKDDYAVVEKPSLTTWMKGGLDYIVLKSLDTDGICIISSVLGQSIALDHYIRQVDDMVEEFTEINGVMEKTGNFTMQRKKNSFNLWGRLIRILWMLSSDLVFLTGSVVLLSCIVLVGLFALQTPGY
ncbi:protein RETARDED ROOT GROWTH, mitochondrial-like [Miscanthus floridulus]|uniref:protein RETARDED ROOT GROWTH, mitochondrial-like n=1 Tax=Miscanthus floridulus TaxID=154761 RepID=UPI00345A47AD